MLEFDQSIFYWFKFLGQSIIYHGVEARGNKFQHCLHFTSFFKNLEIISVGLIHCGVWVQMWSVSILIR
jgi:hypothetical protein